MKPTLLLALALVPATLHAEPAPALPIAVTGPIDPSLVAASVASELAQPVARIDQCTAGCLAVAVVDQQATVTYRAPDGSIRARTIALPADGSQWPLLVSLLAGNLVRDEADALLVDDPPREVPAPPPPTPVAPPVFVPAPAPRFAPFALSLVPGVSTDLLDLQRSHAVSIGLVAESSAHVRGVAISGAVDVAGEVDGAQIAGAVGVAKSLAGAQVSGAVAVAGESTGVQVAGAAAVSMNSRGTQIAGAVAVASATAGTQIAGAVTVTDHLAGVQIAPINIARRNDGVQIGVINFGGGPDGDAFGLINIVPGGRTDLEAAIDSDRTGTLLFRHGGRHWHNVYGVGGQQIDTPSSMPNDDVWMFGLGFGPSFHLGGLPTDLEAIAWHVGHGSEFDNHLSLLAQARMTTSIPLGHLAVIVGGAINTYVTTDAGSPLAIARTTGESMTSDVRVRVWPTAFVGVRL
jgi:hypothetical protein